MSPSLQFDETQIIASVLADDEGDLLRQARALPQAAFSDPTCAALWRRLLALRAGERPSLALVGSGLPADELTRIATAVMPSLDFGGHVRALHRAWAASQAKALAEDFCAGRIDFAEHAERSATLAKPMEDLVVSGSLWPKPASSATLCAKPPETPAVLVEGLLYRGGTMLLSGPSKAHKTFTMLAAGIAIAEGRRWLGFNTAATPVIYLNLELQDFATAKRIESICSATGTKPPARFYPWNLRGRRVTLTELQDRLPQEIKRLEAGAVFIDPHYKVSAVSGMEENSNDSQGLLLGALENICTLNGAALVLSHHFAKGDAGAKTAIDRASGGGVFARWGDVMMTFTPHEEDDAMTVDLALRNFAPVPQFAVRWEHPVWVRDDQLDPAKLKRVGGRTETNTADKALDALGNDAKGYGEWQRASGMTETTFRRKIKVLLEVGRVEQVGNLYRRKAA